jgi:hypothetical protein
MGSFSLSLEATDLRWMAAVNIGVFSFQVTSDTEALNPLPYLIHAETICVGIALGSLQTEAVNQSSIYE